MSAVKASQEHQASIRAQAERFTQSQRDIDRRLRIITESDASDDAVDRFEVSMARLRKLDIADGYVRQLQDVDKLKCVTLSLSSYVQSRNVSLLFVCPICSFTHHLQYSPKPDHNSTFETPRRPLHNIMQFLLQSWPQLHPRPHGYCIQPDAFIWLFVNVAATVSSVSPTWERLTLLL